MDVLGLPSDFLGHLHRLQESFQVTAADVRTVEIQIRPTDFCDRHSVQSVETSHCLPSDLWERRAEEANSLTTPLHEFVEFVRDSSSQAGIHLLEPERTFLAIFPGLLRDLPVQSSACGLRTEIVG